MTQLILVSTSSPLTSDITWNNNNNKIECIGAGGSGNSGTTNRGSGAGGAYSAITNFFFATPGTTTAAYQVGVGGAGVTSTDTANAGGDTWFNSAAFPGAGSDNSKIGAKGGGGATAGAGGVGGAAASGWGQTKSSGGDGFRAAGGAAGGGGGAAGPSGAGGTGSATAGGSADNGVVAGPTVNSNGLSGTEFDGSHGCGTGGLHLTTTTAFSGGLYGGGGAQLSSPNTSGAGANGIIILTWIPAGAANSIFPNPFIPAPLNQGWTRTFSPTLQGKDTLPTLQKDFPYPRGNYIPANGWITTFGQLLIGQDKLPTPQRNFPNPRGVFYTDWYGSTLSFNINLNVIPPIPKNQTDWPSPTRALIPPINTWCQVFNWGMLGQDAITPRCYDYPNPRGPTHPTKDWINTFALSLIGKDVVPAENQKDWPNPTRGVVPSLPTWTWTETGYVGQDVIPFRQQDWPVTLGTVPAVTNKSWLWRTLQYLGLDTIPTLLKDFPNPIRPFILNQSWEKRTPNPVVGKDKLPFKQTDWPVVLGKVHLSDVLSWILSPLNQRPVVPPTPPPPPTKSVTIPDSFALWSPPGPGGRRTRIRSWLS